MARYFCQIIYFQYQTNKQLGYFFEQLLFQSKSRYIQSNRVLTRNPIMKTSSGPFQVSFDSLRQSMPLNFKQQLRFENKFNKKPQFLRIAQLSPSAGKSSIKIIRGPHPDIIFVAMFNKIELLSESLTVQQINYYLCLHIVDLNSLEFRRFLILYQQDSQKVRDVVAHPQSNKFTIIYQNKLQEYIVDKKDQTAWFYSEAKLQSKYQFPFSQFTYDIQYHPNGKSLIGFVTDSQKTYVKLFKMDMLNKTTVMSENLLTTCIEKQFIQYLRKWTVALSKHQDSKALFVGNLDVFCILNLNTMKLEIFNTTSTLIEKFALKYPTISNQTSDLKDRRSFANAYLLNSSHEGNFYVFDSSLNHALLISANQPFNYSKTLNLSMQGKFISFKDAKCVDVTHINGIACMKSDSEVIQIFKYNPTTQQLYLLGSVEAKNGTSSNYSIQTPYVQDLLYNEIKGELCFFYDTIFKCYNISINCTQRSGNRLISSCNAACKEQNNNTFWNPIQMSCQSCVNSCSCLNQDYGFSIQTGKCELNCSNFQNTYQDSLYENGQKCACKHYYSWNKTLKKCRFDCSTIKYYDPQANLQNLDINECKCLPNFRFLKKLGAVDTAGFCQFVCPNGKDADWSNGQPLCNCRFEQIWNPTKLSCLDKNGNPSNNNNFNENKSTGIPVWAIFLIIFASFLLIVGILIFVCKKMKKKQNIDAVPQQSERNQRTKNESPYKKSEQQLKNMRVCPICNIEDVNCMGPCGHYYHFYCIKEKLSEQSNKCPQCDKQFPYGLADIKLVEKQQQVFTISQN